MEFSKVVKEGAWHAIATLLSMGPSQVVGLVKGSVDLVRLALLDAKIARLEKNAPSSNQNFYAQATLEESKALRSERVKSLKSDGLLLIPFLGANLAWRMYKKHPTMDASPLIEFGTKQLLDDKGADFIRAAFYPLSWSVTRNQLIKQGFTIDQKPGDSPAQTVSIPVFDPTNETLSRNLDARYYRHSDDTARPTVVLFHANAMTCDGMHSRAMHYYSQGYDVVCPTMGGYPGSDPCKTSEVTTLQDVEGVRCFLQNQGVRDVGYYGLSIGGTLAFQAACAPSETNLNTKFVIADQTFNKPQDAAANFVPKPLKGMARGASRGVFVKGKKVHLSKTLATTTDGLNNEKKAEELREKKIPLFVIKAHHDDIMSSKTGNLRHNLADTLLKARYPSKKQRKAHTMEIFGQEHAAHFAKSYFDHKSQARHAGHSGNTIKKVKEETSSHYYFVTLSTQALDTFVHDSMPVNKLVNERF